MPWCPKCGLEYVEGVKMCPDCEVPLKDSPMLEEAKPSRDPPPMADKPHLDEKDWVAVVELSDIHQAEMIIGLLDSNGIYAATRDNLGALRYLYGGFSFFSEKIAVYVPKEDAKKAASIIRNKTDWTDEELTEFMVDRGELGQELVGDEE